MNKNDVLYDLITKMNMDFMARNLMNDYIHFTAKDYTVVYDMNDKTYKGNNYRSIIKCDYLDIDAFIQHYHDGIDIQTKELQDKITELKRIQNEQTKSRIPKDISNLIGYEYDTLMVVGGSELIYVHETYNDKDYQLMAIAEKNELLKKYIVENSIVGDVVIKMMTPETYKEKFKVRRF